MSAEKNNCPGDDVAVPHGEVRVHVVGIALKGDNSYKACGLIVPSGTASPEMIRRAVLDAVGKRVAEVRSNGTSGTGCPAMVNSDAYRQGWDQIFGEKGNGERVLN
jgi:hypothetical protein